LLMIYKSLFRWRHRFLIFAIFPLVCPFRFDFLVLPCLTPSKCFQFQIFKIHPWLLHGSSSKRQLEQEGYIKEPCLPLGANRDFSHLDLTTDFLLRASLRLPWIIDKVNGYYGEFKLFDSLHLGGSIPAGPDTK
jgi:hypothetical protein